MRFFFFLAVLFSSFAVHAQDTLFSLSFPDETGGGTTESISGLNLSIQNQFSRPERIAAPNGNALRLDGYSTYLTTSGVYDFNDQVDSLFAIETWYATEAFNASTAGIINQFADGKGFKLGVTPFGRLVFQFKVDASNYVVNTGTDIPTYRWNHIIAQVNLQRQIAEVYLNGDLVGSRSISEHDDFDFADANADLNIGRDNATPTVAGFVTSTLNGAIDELQLHAAYFDSSEVRGRYENIGEVRTELMIDPAVRHPNDHLRPRYHFMPSTLWANEAYGFTYYNDTYHLYFQKNPNAAILNFMHWGHLSSPDLVSWREEPMPLRPQPGWSSVGVWSGTTFFDQSTGQPVIAYTGVNGSFAGIGIATSNDPDLVDWTTIPENPVINRAPANIPNQDFRDPYIWYDNGKYYMVVGSGRANNAGAILMSYVSDDYVNWVQIPPIFEAPDRFTGGTFWEMPYLQKIEGDTYLLVVTPQYIGGPARTIYWTGTFDGDKFEPFHEEPKDFELLNRNLLSPAIGQDENGDPTYIGIIPEDRNVEDQVAAGWRQTFSIPRVLRLVGDDQESIGHYPHPNLCRARRNEVTLTDRVINSGTNFNLPEYQGTQSELSFKLFTGNTNNFRIQVYKNDAGSELTSIVFDKERGRVGIDRTISSPFNTAEFVQYGDYDFRPDDSLNMRVYLDHSILEVFVDNLVVLSARVYPGESSNNVDLVTADGSVDLLEYRAWDMGDKEEEFPEEICPPGDLSVSINDVQSKATQLSSAPNPATSFVNITVPNNWSAGRIEVEIWDAQGKYLQRQILNSVANQVKVSLSDTLPIGLLFCRLRNTNGQLGVARVVRIR